MRKNKRFVNTSITLRKDQLDIIDSMSIELSDWVRKRIDDYFNNPNHLSTEIKDLEDKLDFLKKHREGILLKNNIDTLSIESASPLFEELYTLIKTKKDKPMFSVDSAMERYKQIFNDKFKTNKSLNDFKDMFQKWRSEFK